MNPSWRKLFFLGTQVCFTLIIGLSLLMSVPVRAYTGNFTIAPVNNFVTSASKSFSVNTKKSNPQKLLIQTTYVEVIVITTKTSQIGTLTIQEQSDTQSGSFDVIVPQQLNDNLASATVYIWAPYTDALDVWHYHAGQPAEMVSATRVSPIQTNKIGDILWSFTVSSFSEFFLQRPRPDWWQVSSNQTLLTGALLIALSSFSGVYLFKERRMTHSV